MRFFEPSLAEALAFYQASAGGIAFDHDHPRLTTPSDVNVSAATEKPSSPTRPPCHPSSKKRAAETETERPKRGKADLSTLPITSSYEMSNAINLSLSIDEIVREVKSYGSLTVFALTTNPSFNKHLPEYSFNRKSWIYVDVSAFSEKLISAVKAMPVRTYLYLNEVADPQWRSKQIDLIKNMPEYTVLLLDFSMSADRIAELVCHLQKNVELGIGSFELPFSKSQFAKISQNIPEDSGFYFHNRSTTQNISGLLTELGSKRTVRFDAWMSVHTKNFIIEKASDGTDILCTQDTPRLHLEMMEPYIRNSKNRFLKETVQKNHIERKEVKRTALDEEISGSVNCKI